MKGESIRLKIDVFTPQTLPMARLAEYLKQFAVLLGNEDQVHFDRVDAGSAELLAFVQPSAVSKVKARALGVTDRSAPKAAIKAFAAIDELLAEDGAIGEAVLGNSKIIEFPGRRRNIAEQIGPVFRSTSLDGQVFSIGGKDETINVHLRNGEKEARCIVSIDLAKRLAPYLFGGNVRLFGSGYWYRINSAWQMQSFTAADFLPLNSQPLEPTLGKVGKFFEGVSPEEFLSTMTELREG